MSIDLIHFLVQLSRTVLERNGMDLNILSCASPAIQKPRQSCDTLKQLCYRAILARLAIAQPHHIDTLPLPWFSKNYLKSFSSDYRSHTSLQKQLEYLKKRHSKRHKKKPSLQFNQDYEENATIVKTRKRRQMCTIC